MTSAMIHYTITNLILEKIEVVNKERFPHGATLGPDASSHEDGTYDVAHFENKSADGMKKGFV